MNAVVLCVKVALVLVMLLVAYVIGANVISYAHNGTLFTNILASGLVLVSGVLGISMCLVSCIFIIRVDI